MSFCTILRKDALMLSIKHLIGGSIVAAICLTVIACNISGGRSRADKADPDGRDSKNPRAVAQQTSNSGPHAVVTTNKSKTTPRAWGTLLRAPMLWRVAWHQLSHFSSRSPPPHRVSSRRRRITRSGPEKASSPVLPVVGDRMEFL